MIALAVMCLQIISHQQRKKDYLHIRTYLFLRTVLILKFEKRNKTNDLDV